MRSNVLSRVAARVLKKAWLGSVVLIAIGCSNPGADFSDSTSAQAPPPDPNHNPTSSSPSNSGDWTEVWEKVTACGQPKCAGAQGFGVTKDGHYYVGASSAQATARGELSVTEQELVSKNAVQVASQSFTPSARCMTSDPMPGGTSDVIMRIRIPGMQDPIAVFETTQSGRRTCVRGDEGIASSLRDTLAPVVAKYDPMPVGRPSSGPLPGPTSTPNPRPSWPWPWP